MPFKLSHSFDLVPHAFLSHIDWYNQAQYFHSLGINAKPYVWIKTVNHEVMAFCQFANHKNLWISGLHAPHGGLFFNETLNENDKLNILKNLSENVESPIVIKERPVFEYTIPDNIWMAAGYKNIGTEFNFHHDLQENLLFHVMEKRKIAKNIKAGVEIKIVENEKASELFDFIATCRMAKNIPLNISKNQFINQVTSFSDRYIIFESKLNELRLAVSVFVRVNNQTIYHFLPASEPAFDYLSPMTYLVSETSKYFSEKKYRFLDWGVTSVKGKLQESLALFKTNMGAKMTLKKTWAFNP